MKTIKNYFKVALLSMATMALFQPQSAFAQDTTSYGTPDYKISVGLKLGPTTSDMSGDAAVLNTLESRNGLAAGAFVKYDVKKWMAFQFELMYHQKGVNSTEESDIDRANSYWDVHYLGVPVLAKFQFPIHDMFYPHVALGPTFSYLMTNQADGKVGGVNYNEDKIQNPFENRNNPNPVDPAIEDINTWDVGAAFAGGLDMEFGRFFLGAEYRYNLGFVNVAQDGGQDLDMKNRASTILFALGINF